MLVRNDTRKTLVAEFAEIADSSTTRQRGLLGRNGLANGEGLWIVPCEAVHTMGMRFPIDVLYLDRKRKVRKVRRVLMPWRFSMCLVAHSVLELPAGTADRSQTEPGDQLSFSAV
jgi:uncharacterized membrane protein (UPF0127 family)